MLLGALIFAAILCTVPAALADAYASYRAARTDRWDVVERGRARPGFFERLGRAWGAARAARHRQAGGSGDYRPGVGAYAKDLHHSWFEDRLDHRAKKRAARPEWVYDPDRPRWHERLDAAVLRGARGAKARWDDLVDRARTEQPPTADRDPPAGAYPAGTVTYDADGRQVPLAPEVASQSADPAPTTPDEHTGVVDAITGTDQHDVQEEPMTAPVQTQAAAAATEVNTNEDARRNFEAQAKAAANAADALAAYEAAQAALMAAAQSGHDGMSAKAFDANATASQFNIDDMLSATQMSGAAAAIDAVKTEAEAGLRALDKYRDSEDLVASERVDTTTLAATSS